MQRRRQTASLFALLAMLIAFGSPGLSSAQEISRPQLDWRRLSTTHFEVMFPAELEGWAREMAERLESQHSAVAGMVGYAPRRRTYVLVDDPLNVPNGFAIPFVGRPRMYLFPVAPDPHMSIYEHRSWPELLAVHEFAHLAHLSRPSRNPWQRLLLRITPPDLGPVALRSPRWVTEGYATYIEGELTGSGRPFGTHRAAVLRQRAVEGALPSYGGMNAEPSFMGRSMAYLAGSAYIEWLVQRRGTDAWPDVWRRMTARQRRSFDESFAGVFGGPPSLLYGRFTAELTRDAMAIEDTIRAHGVFEGDTVQRLFWSTGDPALSPDGNRIAIVLRSRDRPSRVVVWNSDPEPDTLAEQRRQRLLERDPEDVPDIPWRPRPLRKLATLHPVAGSAHDHPRFLPDGRRLVVSRMEPDGTGAIRSDVFLWDSESGSLRRVTRGSGISRADPAPHGRTAVADRCLNGSCDIVSVDLETGEIRTLVQGTPIVSYYRPRWSPDGTRIVAAEHRDGRWRVVDVPVAGGSASPIDPDDGASRYDATFTRDGRSLMWISERGGIANVAMWEQGGTERHVTRLTGGAWAPEPRQGTDHIYFLRFHARGFDLARVHPDSVPQLAPVMLDTLRAPVAPREADRPRPQFARAELGPSRPYGIGPREWRLLPLGYHSTEGNAPGIAITGTDPAGRLTLLGQYMIRGAGGAWDGGAASVAWRRFPVALTTEAFLLRQRPSDQRRSPVNVPQLDADHTGAAIIAEWERRVRPMGWGWRAGGTFARLSPVTGDAGERRAGFAHLSNNVVGGLGRLTLRMGVQVEGAAGSTLDRSWTRGLGSLAISASSERLGVTALGALGRVSTDAPEFERFAVGGIQPPLVDPIVLHQRIPNPAIPAVTLLGDELRLARIGLVTGGALEPYALAVRTGGSDAPWLRTVGLEQVLQLPPLPIARVASVRLRTGVGYTLDEPYRRRVRYYVSGVYRP